MIKHINWKVTFQGVQLVFLKDKIFKDNIAKYFLSAGCL